MIIAMPGAGQAEKPLFPADLPSSGWVQFRAEGYAQLL